MPAKRCTWLSCRCSQALAAAKLQIHHERLLRLLLLGCAYEVQTVHVAHPMQTSIFAANPSAVSKKGKAEALVAAATSLEILAFARAGTSK